MTRVNELGLIEVVPPNTPRFNYDAVILPQLGLLLEPEAENMITESKITLWGRVRVTVTAILSTFADPTYFRKGNVAP